MSSWVNVNWFPTWTRWGHPPCGCMPMPSDWHQLSADPSSWPLGVTQQTSTLRYLVYKMTNKAAGKVSVELVRERKKWGRSWRQFKTLTGPTTDTSKQSGRYKKARPPTSHSKSNCAHQGSKWCIVCIWTTHMSVLKGFHWQIYLHTINYQFKCWESITAYKPLLS